MTPNLQELCELQKELAQQVELPLQGYQPKADDWLVALDIQYVGEEAYAGLDLFRGDGEALTTYVHKAEAGMAYVPRFFSFREGPPLAAAVQTLEAKLDQPISCLLIDGHGIAHPRKLGVASWLGVQLGLPSIGMAKRSLLPFEGQLLDEQRGATQPVLLEEEQVGVTLRTQDAIKPVFVSVGHQVSLATAIELILLTSEGGYRIPEPFRRADQAARAFAKGEMGDWEVLDSRC